MYVVREVSWLCRYSTMLIYHRLHCLVDSIFEILCSGASIVVSFLIRVVVCC